MQMEGRARNLPLSALPQERATRLEVLREKVTKNTDGRKTGQWGSPFSRLARQQRDVRMCSSRGSAGSLPVVPAKWRAVPGICP